MGGVPGGSAVRLFLNARKINRGLAILAHQRQCRWYRRFDLFASAAEAPEGEEAAETEDEVGQPRGRQRGQGAAPA